MVDPLVQKIDEMIDYRKTTEGWDSAVVDLKEVKKLILEDRKRIVKELEQEKIAYETLMAEGGLKQSYTEVHKYSDGIEYAIYILKGEEEIRAAKFKRKS